jgi:ABC-type nickel/cobalt efflux system permease component RcnA
MNPDVTTRPFAERATRWLLLIGSLMLCVAAPSRADTVASLLGNFTINQFAGLRLGANRAAIRYTVVFGQLPALRELHSADADGDGVTTQDERDRYAGTLAPALADGLLLRVDGAAVPLRVARWTTSLPAEQSGFSLRVDVDLAGVLPDGGDVHRVELVNRNYAGRFGWQEIVVTAAPGTAVFDTDAFSNSLTAGLTEAVQAMPADGPLAERTAHLAYRVGEKPADAAALGPRPGTTSPIAASAAPATPDASSWLARKTRRLVDLIATPSVPLYVAVYALLAALVLGALHALSPGHGKTVVGAYLIGSRGTPRHAVFLGVTVTVTHTIGVFALGIATLFASRYFLPERLLPMLSLISGLLVVGMGLALLRQRWRGARAALEPPARAVYRALDAASVRGALPLARVNAPSGLAFAHGATTHAHDHAHAHHDHHHGRGHGHVHHHGALVHSHGGGTHSHLPPGAAGEPVTWRSLLALGVSGGLVPCPSALVLLLAAVALNKTGYGLLLVLAFSVGLAATLTAVGLAFLYARDRLARWRGHARWLRLLPVASAAAITLVGVLMCYGAVAAAS